MTEVAKTYGGALFDLSAQEGNDQELLEQVTVLAQAFDENPDFVKLLRTPSLRKEERLSVLEQSFGDQVHPYVLNFMKILVEQGYIGDFSACAQEFRSRYNEAHNIEEVTAVTAVPLSPELGEKLRQKLEGLLHKTILLSNSVDPSVLGGVRLEMKGVQLEGSVQHQLDALRRQLDSVTL